MLEKQMIYKALFQMIEPYDTEAFAEGLSAAELDEQIEQLLERF